ncbi:hypothetical protein BDV19DRAFT_364518 [Aspergillus venezuelensis]
MRYSSTDGFDALRRRHEVNGVLGVVANQGLVACFCTWYSVVTAIASILPISTFRSGMLAYTRQRVQAH